MNDSDYFLELYRQRAKRIRHITLLLVTIFGLMLVDFYIHQWKFEDYYSKLPIVLYDFSQKYTKPLSEWWRGYKDRSETPTIRSADPMAISFQSIDRADTDKGINWGRIPFLHEHLAPYRPGVGDAREFFGWRLPTPLYLVVALFIPSALLLWLLIDTHFLRQASILLREGAGRKTKILILQSVFTDRIGPKKDIMRRLGAVTTAASLFALATASAALVIMAPMQGWYSVEGTLYLSPQFPNVLSARDLDSGPPQFWVGLWLTLAAVNAVLSALIARELVDIKT